MTRNEIEKLYDELLRAEEKSINEDTERAVEEYDKRKKELIAQNAAEARRLYTAYTRSVTDLPAQLARMGITGGAAETRALRLRNGYVNSADELSDELAKESGEIDSSVEQLRRKAETARAEARAQNATQRLNAVLKAESDAVAEAKAQAELLKAQKELAEAEAEREAAASKRNETEEALTDAVDKAVASARKEWVSQEISDESDRPMEDKQLLSMLDVVKPYASLMDKSDTQISLARKLILRVGPQMADGYAKALIAARKKGLL